MSKDKTKREEGTKILNVKLDWLLIKWKGGSKASSLQETTGKNC